mmetsp:Transcript_55334/g.161515  ORF Transcript_55334/g.161515 Transcript_55334/m.161515 type:complete len:344 (+) Transcript_55334:1435-2466(+)
MAFGNLGLELLALHLEALDKTTLTFSILLGNGLDRLDTLCKLQGAQGLVVVDLCRAERRDHDGLGVPAQGVHEGHCELGVAKRHKVATGHPGLLLRHLGQLENHIREVRKALVDGSTLLERASGGLRALLPLGASEVYEIELRAEGLRGRPVLAGYLAPDLEGEDAVRAAGLVVHASGSDHAVLGAKLQQLMHVFLREHWCLLEILDVHSNLGAVPDLEPRGVARRRQEVPERLHVDLQVCNTARVGAHAFPAGAQRIEDLGRHAGQQAWLVRGAKHAEGLAAARLAVGKEAAVVTIQCILLQLYTEVCHQRLLRGKVLATGVDGRIKGPVKVEGLLSVEDIG